MRGGDAGRREGVVPSHGRGAEEDRGREEETTPERGSNGMDTDAPMREEGVRASGPPQGGGTVDVRMVFSRGTQRYESAARIPEHASVGAVVERVVRLTKGTGQAAATLSRLRQTAGSLWDTPISRISHPLFFGSDSSTAARDSAQLIASVGPGGWEALLRL